MSERRRFSRVIYKVPASLHQGAVETRCSIIDLSLHGLLLSTPEQPLDPALPLEVRFHIPESDIDISLQADIVAAEGNAIRAKIHYIDIDSISYLKRLIELNMGNDDLLHREMEMLSDLGDLD